MKLTARKIGELFERFSSGKNLTEDKIENQGKYPVYGGNGLRGYTTEYNFEGECLIVGRQGAKCGNVRYFSGKGYMTDHAIVGVSNKNNSTRFLSYALSGLNLNRLSGQSAQPGLSVSMLKKQKVLVPDLSTQNKIADFISRYDNLIELNNQRIKLLEQTAEEIYKEWFVRFRFPGYENVEIKNGVPSGWETLKVKNIIKRLPFGTTYKSEELEDEGSVIVIDQSEEEYLGYHNYSPSHCANFDEPLIIFGDHSCKCQLMTKDFSLGENVIPFTVNNTNEYSLYYIFYATKDLIHTEEYKRHWSRLVNFKIFKPSYSIQKSFEDLIKPLIKEKESLWSANTILIKQRNYLLPRLMSGKLEV